MDVVTIPETKESKLAVSGKSVGKYLCFYNWRRIICDKGKHKVQVTAIPKEKLQYKASRTKITITCVVTETFDDNRAKKKNKQTNTQTNKQTRKIII